MTLSGEWVAPWGQRYGWSVDERSLTITTQAKSDKQPRTSTFPAGLASAIASAMAGDAVRRLLGPSDCEVRR